MERFNPNNSEYKRVADLPKEEQQGHRDVDGGFVKKTAREMNDIQESTDELNRAEIQERAREAIAKFVNDLQEEFSKFDSELTVGVKDAANSVAVLNNGKISGYINNLAVEKDENSTSLLFANPYNHDQILKSVAFVLQKNGVKVFSNQHNLYVVLKSGQGNYEKKQGHKVAFLYSEEKRYYQGIRISSNDESCLPNFEFRDGKLMRRISPKSSPELEFEEIPEFSQNV